jgi:hypothetical protein
MSSALKDSFKVCIEGLMKGQGLIIRPLRPLKGLIRISRLYKALKGLYKAWFWFATASSTRLGA